MGIYVFWPIMYASQHLQWKKVGMFSVTYFYNLPSFSYYLTCSPFILFIFVWGLFGPALILVLFLLCDNESASKSLKGSKKTTLKKTSYKTLWISLTVGLQLLFFYIFHEVRIRLMFIMKNSDLIFITSGTSGIQCL